MSSKNYKWIDHGPYWELDIDQGEEGWLDGRLGRITGSTSAAMANRSRFKTAEEQGLIIAGVKKEEFTPEEIERMGHGTTTEPVARKWCEDYCGETIAERGLIVPKWDPEIGISVDGEGSDFIIEIKCPQRMYWPLEQYMDQLKTGWVPRDDYRKHIWSSHYDQMQQGMAVLGKKWCIYVVYSTNDRKVFTQKIPFNPEYWDEHYRTIKKNYDVYIRPHLNGKYPIMPQ